MTATRRRRKRFGVDGGCARIRREQTTFRVETHARRGRARSRRRGATRAYGGGYRRGVFPPARVMDRLPKCRRCGRGYRRALAAGAGRSSSVSWRRGAGLELAAATPHRRTCCACGRRHLDGVEQLDAVRATTVPSLVGSGRVRRRVICAKSSYLMFEDDRAGAQVGRGARRAPDLVGLVAQDDLDRSRGSARSRSKVCSWPTDTGSLGRARPARGSSPRASAARWRPRRRAEPARQLASG